MTYWSFYKTIDLHGEFATTAYTVVHDFITEQIKLKNEYIAIIHGKGSGKLKEEVHRILKQDKRVVVFHLDSENLGQTLVQLKIK